VARPLGLIRHGDLVSVIGSYLSIRLQHSLNNAIRAQALRGKVTKRWWHTSRVRIPNDAMTDIRLVPMFLAPEGHSRVLTRPIGLLIPRSPTITPISDACYGDLGCWAQGHTLIWRLIKADLEAYSFILPTGREPSEAEKKERDFDHINILEFVAVIVNIWVAVRYLMLQPLRTAHVIMNVLSDSTSALSWMKHAAQTKKKPVRCLARFLQALLTYCPLPIRVQGDHIKGDENAVADLLSRFSLAPHWVSAIAQTSPTLDLSRACQVPQELLFKLALLLRSDGDAAMSESEMTRLWALELRYLPPGWQASTSMTSLCKKSRRPRPSRS
jgi:hypothetical protein